MTTTGDSTQPTRRAVLSAAAAATAAGSLAITSPVAADRGSLGEVVRFHGLRQAGITTRQQTHVVLCAFDVTGDRSALVGLLKQWTSLFEAITQGDPAPARSMTVPGARVDSGLTRGIPPARLTATVGFGASLFDDRFGLQDRRPEALKALPAFPGDQLVEEHSNGDLLVQLCADDPQVLAHAFLHLRSASVRGARLRWSQQGFISPPTDGRAPRNLIGLHDGTSNPSPASPGFDRLVWAGAPAAPEWLRGGSYLVFRKIRLGLPEWSLTAAGEQDRAVGRRLPDGSPLSARPGVPARHPLDLEARDEHGRLRIDRDAHVRRMHPFPMYRRAFNYDYGFDVTRGAHEHGGAEEPGHEHGGHQAYDAGLLFLTYNRDPHAQFVAAQHQLTSGDLLARFMTPTASGLYAVPPGLQRGQQLGHGLLT